MSLFFTSPENIDEKKKYIAKIEIIDKNVIKCKNYSLLRYSTKKLLL